MDPTKTQTDPANDSHSLENADGASPAPAATTDSGENKTGEDGVLDATGGSATPAATPKNKQSPLKKVWRKFNVYLLLFVLVLVLAIGVLVFVTLKSKQAAQAPLKSQGLSQDALQQLASTDVTVGDTNQVLTVQSNAIFAGAVLVKNSLGVAGSLQVGGGLSIANLTVGGATQLGDTQTKNLTVDGALNIQGAFALKDGIDVSGNSNFAGTVTVTQLNTGALQLNGDLTLTHHVIAGGTIPTITRGSAVGGGGTVSLNGSDTSGSITINTGSSPPAGCFATVTFSKTFSNTPHVVVTPIDAPAAGLQFYVTRTTSQFVLCSATAAPTGQTFGFDYVVLD